MKQLVDNKQAKMLSNLQVNTNAKETIGENLYPAPTIGELIEWVDGHTEAWEIMTSEQGFEILAYNKGQIQADEIYKELIDALVKLAIKIQESK